MIRRLGTALGLVIAPLFSPVAAQQDSVLQQAVRLATEGQSDTAQAIVRQYLRSTSPGDRLFPEILYTAGLVADNADSARSYFRRVSIEYSTSPWADHSLLRLAQIAYGSGDTDAAERSADRVLIDYPFSPVRAEAAFLLAMLHLDRRELDAGCRYLEESRAAAADDVELANRAAFYIQRCANRTTAPPDSTATPETSSGPVFYAVQVAAVSSVAAADEIMRGLEREGFSAQVVREGEFFKIRVGRFRRRADAQALLQDIKRKMGGKPFIVENP